MKDKKTLVDLDQIEIFPDGWERTERAIRSAMRRKPLPRTSEKQKAPDADDQKS